MNGTVDSRGHLHRRVPCCARPFVERLLLDRGGVFCCRSFYFFRSPRDDTSVEEFKAPFFLGSFFSRGWE